MHRLPLSPTPEDDAFETRATKASGVVMGVLWGGGANLYLLFDN